MKLRYLLSAIAGVALLASCTEEPPVVSSDLAINLSQSVVAIPTEGGSKTVEVNSGDVTWTATSKADWISFTPATGKGKTNVTVTVGESLDDRTGEIILTAEGIEKYITVIQTGDPHGLTEDDPLTCADAIALCAKLADKATTGKKYYVKGIITNVIEEFGTEYGNATFWMGDEEGQKTFEAYRIYYFDNAKYDDPKKQNISEGDNVLIYGILMNYGGQAETSQNAAYLVKLDANTAPALSCKEPEVAVGASETAASFDITAKNLTGKWTVTKDAESTWVKSFTPEGTESGKIEISLEANEGDERTATFTVKSDGAKDLTLTLKQGKYSAVGTLDKPYTVAGIIEALKAGPVAGNVYIKGIVSNTTKYNFGGEKQYNTASFWISDDGVYNDDLDKDFEAYSVYYLGGSLDAPTAGADIKANFKVGDEVILFGAVTAYTNKDVTTYETSSKKAKIYSINWATSDENGVGNVDYPFNVAGAEKFIDDTQVALTAAKAAGETLNLPDVAVKGKISAVLFTYDATHNTGSFWISDDGTAYGVSDDKKSTSEPTKDFECYSVYMFGIDAPWTEGTYPQPAVGDDVIVKGQLTIYKGTYETSSKKAWIYSLNGKTSVAAE